jgi:mannosyltransferase OCH1-like enzyme
VKVWTDDDAPCFPFINRRAFDDAQNYGEKSDIWRYEILYRHGGVYADTDFECLKPFDDLHKTCEFYAGVGQMKEAELINALIGSRPNHPILQALIENIKPGAGDHDPWRIIADTGPYYFTRIFLEVAPSCAQGTVVPFPTTFFYPFPLWQRHRRDVVNIKREFVKPESLAIHYFSTSWQK